MTERSPADPSASSPAAFDFDQSLQEIEAKIDQLKQRREKILLARQGQVARQGRRVDPETLNVIQDTKAIAEDLSKIEYQLASEVIDWVGEDYLSWKTPGESFWTFFRYAGIGFLVAMALHWLIR